MRVSRALQAEEEHVQRCRTTEGQCGLSGESRKVGVIEDENAEVKLDSSTDGLACESGVRCIHLINVFLPSTFYVDVTPWVQIQTLLVTS